MTKKPTVAVIDYDMGNLWSVQTAIHYLGIETQLVREPEQLGDFSHIILPGVGSFRIGMETLNASGMSEAIIAAAGQGKQLLGICLGMQLFGQDSVEDCADGEVTPGLGLVKCPVRAFSFSGSHQLKVPHVGFNSIEMSREEGLFAHLGASADFYFTHSFRMLPGEFDGNAATCHHGEPFLAAFDKDNVSGAQFHPEKSQTNGLLMLKNFLEKPSC